MGQQSMLLLGGVKVIAKSYLLGGTRYHYKGGDNINTNWKNKIVSFYISMSEKASKQNTNTIKTDAATKIQKLKLINKHITRNTQSKLSIISSLKTRINTARTLDLSSM